MSKKDDPKNLSKWGKGQTDPDTWWKKGGPSPNPKGRPKGSKSQKTLYKEAFEKKITVTMDGEHKTMTKKELGYHQLAQKAAAGDLKAFPHCKFDDQVDSTVQLLSASDFAQFHQRLQYLS
jgi:hypothetical protein